MSNPEDDKNLIWIKEKIDQQAGDDEQLSKQLLDKIIDRIASWDK